MLHLVLQPNTLALTAHCSFALKTIAQLTVQSQKASLDARPVELAGGEVR